MSSRGTADGSLERRWTTTCVHLVRPLEGDCGGGKNELGMDEYLMYECHSAEKMLEEPVLVCFM